MAMFETAYTMETKTDAAVLLHMIEDAPAADVTPVRHGKWVRTGKYGTRRKCSVCEWDGPEYIQWYCWCPNCGAKMNERDEDDAG